MCLLLPSEKTDKLAKARNAEFLMLNPRLIVTCRSADCNADLDWQHAPRHDQVLSNPCQVLRISASMEILSCAAGLQAHAPSMLYAGQRLASHAEPA